MKQEQVLFIQEVDRLFPDPEKKSFAVAMALGVVLGRSILLPRTLEEASSDDYNQDNLSYIDNGISKLNELIVLDIQLARSIAKSTFMVRYFALYPREIRITEDNCFCSDIFDISSQFKSIDSSIIQDSKPQMLVLIEKIARILAEEDN